ncbi:MAG: hydroxymethylbilane synthase [Acidimicrobiaceae bacterium]|nr:hydroxymethylbilane synthase [Acidimicrobiaceae bacterium]
MTLRLATRRSPLALAQAHYVADRLAERGFASELVSMETTGDQRQSESLRELGGRGVFAVEIQRALLEGRADVAVHSAKDLPSSTPPGLMIAAVPPREDARDVVVGARLDQLEAGDTVATGSPRRRALLLERRPDLDVVELRGNMARRLSRVGEDGVRAILAAAAALARLAVVPDVAEVLDPEWFVPQVGQGALALEVRADDVATREVITLLNDEPSRAALLAERSFLVELGAGCSIPAGAHARVEGGDVRLSGVMLDPDGRRSVRVERRGSDPVALGREVACYLRDEAGGRDLPGWRAP